MKLIFILSNILLPLFGLSQLTNKPFRIDGDVSSVKLKIDKVHYRYMVGGIYVDDSAVVKNNRYVLKGMLDEHVMLQSSASYFDTSLKHDYKRDYHVVHLVPGTNATVKHKEKFAEAEIKGSAAQDEYMQLHQRLIKGETGFLPEYIEKKPNSPLAVFLLNQFIIGPFLDVEAHEKYYKLLSEQNRNTPSGKKLGERFEIARKTAIGNNSIDVQQMDSTGKQVRLSDFKGKYVLLEFWASWCSPCRRENPALVKLYQTFQGKGFEILGISVDESRKHWLNAVKKDGLIWTNTADILNTDKNPAANAYGVTAIPTNYLIDPLGKIIGKNLRGEVLEKKLHEIFGD